MKIFRWIRSLFKLNKNKIMVKETSIENPVIEEDCDGEKGSLKRGEDTSSLKRRFVKYIVITMSCGAIIYLLTKGPGLPSEGHPEFVTLMESVSSDKSPPSKRKFVRSGLILFTGITLLYFFPVPYATLYRIKCAGWRLFYHIAYKTIWSKYNLAPIHIIVNHVDGERLPDGVALIYTIWPTPDDGPGGIRCLDVTELTPIYIPTS